MMARYRTKPCEIEAVEWNGSNISEINDFAEKSVLWLNDAKGNPILEILTLEGIMLTNVGDFIIRGLRGEYYPCKPDVFHRKYELISENIITDL